MRTRVRLWRHALLPVIAGLCATMAAPCAWSAQPATPDIPQGMTAAQAKVAEQIPNLGALHVDKASIPSHVRGELGHFEIKSGTPDAQAAVFLGKMRALLRAGNSESLRLRNAEHDEARGISHYRFDQTIDGLDVIGGEVTLHVENATSRIVSMEAQFLPASGLPRKPALAGSAALANVLAELNATDVEELSAPRLAFARMPTATGHLVWASLVSYLDAKGRRQKDLLLTDAITGELVRRLPQVFDVLDREVRDFADGEILISDRRPISTDAAALNVMTFSADTYNYFFTFFGRDSPLNNGALMRSFVHGTPHGQKNAEFDPFTGTTFFGDGDGVEFGPFSSGRDVVAHEWTHAVIWTGPRLSYSGQSGALNESISDIFAAAVEAWARGVVDVNTWRAGEDIYTPGISGDAVRYMDAPTWDGHSRDFYPELRTTDDVHYGSGIGNLAFKLMAAGGLHPRQKTAILVQPMGIEHAARIVYLTLPRLQSESDYPFAADRMTEVAAAEFGYGSLEHGSTCRAWQAVGVPVTPANCLPPGPPSSITPDFGTCPRGVTLSWPAVAGATSYRLYRSEGNFNGPTLALLYEGPNTFHLDRRSPRIVGYYYKVASCTAVGCGAMSDATARGTCYE